ncbi:MAG TPA: alpha/beta fold hydrolase [Actinocrinis sp.]|nr:alpha/beta fold hydrolase [Actinocrinis sp.]
MPLDWSDPAAGTTHVAFALIRHRDASASQGTIVYNPGGPGLTVIQQADSLVSTFAPVLDQHDLLLFDPRGTGLSDPLSCPGFSASQAFASAAVQAAADGACGRSLGAAAAHYGTDAIADDLDALRAALGIGGLNLWGESYGSYLMQVYAALFPQHVRSVLLSGPIPIDFPPLGNDQAAASRQAIDLVCARSGGACQGPAVLAAIARLGAQLERQPVRFTARLGSQRFPAVLDRAQLASVVYNADNALPEFGRIPAAVDSALAGDYAPLEQLVTETQAAPAFVLGGSPQASALVDAAMGRATSCHDYPRVFSYADPVAVRVREYQQALRAANPADFSPFSPLAWSEAGVIGSGIVGTFDCIDWPDEPTTPSPLPPGARMPDVPTLVLAGDLDTTAPVAFGRRAAAEFPDSRLVVIPDIGHVPTEGDACALDLGLSFIRTLNIDGGDCAGTGTAPAVTAPQPLTAAGIPPVPGIAAPAARQAVGLVLAAEADFANQSAILSLWGSAPGLRGGTYTAQPDGTFALDAVRVVNDATIDGTVTLGGSGGGSATLTLGGTGVENGTLAVTIDVRGHGTATGTLAGAPVDISF